MPPSCTMSYRSKAYKIQKIKWGVEEEFMHGIRELSRRNPVPRVKVRPKNHSALHLASFTWWWWRRRRRNGHAACGIIGLIGSSSTDYLPPLSETFTLSPNSLLPNIGYQISDRYCDVTTVTPFPCAPKFGG
ncbi:hypothetical protein EX30DRAFT_352042 [Ascodesmis nigricans]|uniref:Uncharacterized protein n=1 Tax=Ascodesmis nigricans TaxID=341454 RepID=A0A4S2MK75_9PEZI|nr:hypothetical protein EX30DRAFT_352042 [Ascodesmis nigricans]